MPIPLPHFDNNIDPTLPEIIKPELYIFDEYQTYDLVKIHSPNYKLSNVIKSYFGFGNESDFFCVCNLVNAGHCLIERYTPKNNLMINYSEIIYQYFKRFAGTGLCNDPYYSGENHPNANLIDFGSQTVINKYNENWKSLTLNIPANSNREDIIISWFKSGNYNECMKSNHTIITSNQSYTIAIHINHIQPCSLIVECNNQSLKNQIISQIPEVFLFININNIFTDLIQQIEIAFPKLDKFLGKLEFTGNIEFKMYPSNGTLSGNRNTIIDGDFVISDDHFLPIPDFFKQSCLIYANNNYWNCIENNTLTDQGGKTYFYMDSYNNLNYSLIPDIDDTSKLLYGYDVFNDWANSFYIARWEVPLINYYPDSSGYPTNKISDSVPYGNYFCLDYIGQIIGNYNYIWMFYFFHNPHYDADKVDYLLNYYNKNYKLCHVLGFLKIPILLGKFMTQNIINIGNTHNIEPKDFKIFQGIGITENGQTMQVIDETTTSYYEETQITAYDPYWTIDHNIPWIVNHPIALIWEYDLIPRETIFKQDLDITSIINAIDQTIHYREILINGENTMPDSIRLKEIHEALNAQNFANALDENNQQIQRFANLGYYVERIARVLGINVNPDGSVRSIRQSKFIKQGDEIPAGWSIGQWGRNQGGDPDGQKGGSETEDRDGLAYEVRSNKFSVDKFSGEATAIEQGGYVLVENLPQLLHIILSDLDKALGWAEAGANVLPNPNGTKPIPYEGLNTLLAEVAFMLSQLSRNITGTHISALKNQGMLLELIAHQGVITKLKQIEIDIGIDESANLVYPSLNGITQFEQNALILSNLSLLIGSILKPEVKK